MEEQKSEDNILCAKNMIFPYIPQPHSKILPEIQIFLQVFLKGNQPKIVISKYWERGQMGRVQCIKSSLSNNLHKELSINH